jgi:hypothetical protein
MEKEGVFISHWDPEKGVALELQAFLRKAFGDSFKVFVSSDYRSIPGGAMWFSSIMVGLKAAKVVLVLISEHSTDNRWLNFEAGVGLGSEARVVPVVFRNCPKASVGYPFACLQVRDLGDAGDVEALLDEIAADTETARNAVDVSAFISEAKRLESSIAQSLVVMKPVVTDMNGELGLTFSLENNGNRDADVLMVELQVPAYYLRPNFHPVFSHNVLDVERPTIDGHACLKLRFKAKDPNLGYRGGTMQVLPLLSPGMPPHITGSPFYVALRKDIPQGEWDLPITFGVYLRGLQPVIRRTTYRELVDALRT